jgi:aspartyl-tRNA synthetase
MCGELRATDAGKQVVLMGWVNRRRDHGNLIFLDLRDRTGIAQVVLDHDLIPEGHAKGEQVRPEYVVAAVGKVRLRDKDAINPKMPTGEIEIEATELRVLNDARLAPFSPPKRRSRTRKCGSNTATSICGAPRCSTTSSCGTRLRWPFARA